jgi:Bacterial PH domain
VYRWFANVRRWLADAGRSFVQRSSASARRVPSRVVYVDVPPRLVNKYLLPSEKIVTAVRMHPIAVISPVIVILAGALVAGFVTESAAQAGNVGGTPIIWILWAVLAVWQGWKVATWWRRYFVVTENRLMLITSLLDTDVGMMPLAKVTDMRLHQTTFGHTLGYAELIVESAGQDQALSRVNFVPYPSQMYQEILSLIFSPKPAGSNGGDLCLDWLPGIAWLPVGAIPGHGIGGTARPVAGAGRQVQPRLTA